MPDAVIQAQDLSKQFILRHNRSLSIKSRVVGLLHERHRERLEPFWALRDVSLSIGRGERVGLIGRNGSGKSTLLKLIAGIHRPTSGHLFVTRGARIGSMIELGVGFHPDLTGAENVFLNAAIHGRSRSEIEAIYPKIVEYSGLAHFMDVALKNYSSGMHVRLGFAIAANLEPDVILLDEIFAVGDEDFQKKCMETMDRFASEGRTIIFVSHAMSAVRRMCQRVCVLDHGRLQFDGEVDEGIAAYHKLITASSAASAEKVKPTDYAILWRRYVTEWAVGLIEREGFGSSRRILEVSVEPAPDPEGPLLRHVGPERYAYWQAGRPAVDDPEPVDVAVAATVFMHFPLNAIARIIATTLGALPPGGSFYATFFEAPAGDPFAPRTWPQGFVTSADTVPYHYTFGMIEGIAASVGATTTRVSDAAHPNGETTVVMRRRPH